MKIDIQTVEKIAHLARLSLSEQEKESMVSDLSKILDFMDKLNEVDTEKVEPLIYLNEEAHKPRADEVIKISTKEEILKNAPKTDGNHFQVPKAPGIK